MKIFKLDFRSLTLVVSAICVAFALSSCIDDDYNLDNITPEVTIGGEEVILPLLSMDPIKLSSMLGSGLTGLVEEDGGYVLKFKGDGQTFKIEGFSLPTLSDLAPKVEQMTFQTPTLPTDFLFSEIVSTFPLSYPDMSVAPSFSPIEYSSDIELGISLPNGAMVPALGELKFEDEGKVEFPASFEIPEQIRSIGKVYFGEKVGDWGSPIEVALEFKGLKSINGGGKLDFDAVFPSNYALVDANGKSIGNVLKVYDYAVGAGVESVVIKAYLQSMDFSRNTVARGTMNINDEISYQFKYTFESVSGYCNASTLPQFRLDVAPQFRDLEVVLNDVVIDNENHSSEVVYTLNGIPESIQSIDYIAFSSAPITMRVDGLSWLKVDGVNVEVQMPECFVFAEQSSEWLNTATNKMTAPLAKLANGVQLNLKAIDLSKGDINLANGQLTIHAAITSHISDIKGGQKMMLSEIVPPSSQINISTIVEETHFALDLAKCNVVMKDQYFDFKLDETQLPSLKHTISVPDELASIDRLELQTPKGEKVKVRLGISHPKDEIFPVDEVYLTLTVNLKKMIHPVEGQEYIEKAPNGDYILRIDHKKWRPNENPHLDVVEIEIDAIENLPAVTGPKGARELVIDEKFAVTGGVSIDAGTDVNLESSSSKLNIDFQIDDAQIAKFYGKIDYKLVPDNLPELQLGDLASSGLEVANLDIAPIIRLNLQNPIDVPFNVSLALKPYDADGKLLEDNKLELNDVHIEGLGETHLVLSTRDRRDQFANQEGVNFVEADLGKLFKGQLPAKVAIAMEVASDLSTTHVVDLTQSSYEIAYDYSVDIPLEFGHDFDISYQAELPLGDILGSDADVDVEPGYEDDSKGPLATFLSMVETGEVSVIADFVTTIPLDFVLEAECFDKEGKLLDTQIVFEDGLNLIHGHHPEDADSEAQSHLVLKLDLDENGRLESLTEIDVLRLKLNLRNNSETPSTLSPDQTISAKTWLRVCDGITINLGAKKE